MKTLDLHGHLHHLIGNKISDFIVLNNKPIKIITGKSDKMREIVISLIKKHGYDWHYHNWQNAGCLVITEEVIR